RRTFFVWDGNVPLAAVIGQEAEIYLADHLGSARVAIDAQGKLLRRMDYDSFGVPRQELSGRVLQPGFAGVFYDAAAALYGAGASGPAPGQFPQPGPEISISLGFPTVFLELCFVGRCPGKFCGRGGGGGGKPQKESPPKNWRGGLNPREKRRPTRRVVDPPA